MDLKEKNAKPVLSAKRSAGEQWQRAAPWSQHKAGTHGRPRAGTLVVLRQV